MNPLPVGYLDRELVLLAGGADILLIETVGVGQVEDPQQVFRGNRDEGLARGEGDVGRLVAHPEGPHRRAHGDVHQGWRMRMPRVAPAATVPIAICESYLWRTISG